ncbi:unnamed protein product [Microthlaspi erraticum]|uniref:Uncharacterized protein n=1 Tax=Microthlaspi erraticum TaxID=1685480 RepID=A0A6D2KHP0_9BRAS|nr:unnamed protein product [Microthlaspi erraticum]
MTPATINTAPWFAAWPRPIGVDLPGRISAVPKHLRSVSFRPLGSFSEFSFKVALHGTILAGLRHRYALCLHLGRGSSLNRVEAEGSRVRVSQERAFLSLLIKIGF